MSDDKKKMKLLFIPKEATDEENLSTTGLARKMIEKGHRVKFIVCDHNKRLDQLGLEYDILSKEPTAGQTSQEPLAQSSGNSKPSLITNWINYIQTTLNQIKAELVHMEEKNSQLEKIIARYNPDMFITDDFFEYFSVSKTDKPWIWLFNGNPLTILSDENLPPPYSGLPSDKPTLMWALNRLLYNLLIRLMRSLFNFGLSALGKPFRLIIDGSPYLNFFSYPKELDYEKRKQWKQNYYRVDSFLLKDTKFKNELKIPPEKLSKDKQRRVVFVSMGSTHSANTFFMNKLLQTLSKSPHLYLFSKLHSPEEYQLSDNMWSDGISSAFQMLEKSELFITDGSNETVTDAFTLGKPMIVIPMWLAQLDNAQRVDETGFGVRLSAWTFTEEQLLAAINRLLNDQELKSRLNKASNRIWEENRLDKASELIDNLGRDKWFYKHN